MPALHATNVNNVEASINAAIATALAAVSLPSYLSAIPVIYDYPEIAANTPCFSIAHFATSTMDKYQGRGDGTPGNYAIHAHGLMEISAWVSRDQRVSGQDVWVARLRFMASMILSAVAGNPIILIRDYVTSPTAPALTGYKVNIETPEFQVTADDPNPAIRRRRATVGYRWDLRA